MAYIGKRPVDTFPAINAVTSTLIAENNITAREIATNTIVTLLIADNAVTSVKIAENAITAREIAQNIITVAHLADSAVETAKINDNAVTLAKMAGLARGKIIIGDSSGDPVALSVGSNGQVLTSDGTDISWGTDAVLTTENVQDIAGGMFTGNTETGITATYQDGDGTVDLVIGTLNQDTTGLAATATALATARTIHGVSFDGTANIDLSEVVSDTVGAMFSSNTETGITATYQDGDNTIDLVVGTLNQDTTGNAATATALETARTIGGTSFDGTANIAVGLAATATALASARTIGGTSFDGTANIVPGTATALATGRTIGMTGDVVWTSASFDGSGNVTGAATIQANAVESAMIAENNITTRELAANTIATGNIADNAVDGTKIAQNSILTRHIDDGQVTTDQLGADAVTGAKIADDAINSEHYTDGSIDTAHIADAQVTAAKLANTAVTAAA